VVGLALDTSFKKLLIIYFLISIKQLMNNLKQIYLYIIYNVELIFFYESQNLLETKQKGYTKIGGTIAYTQ